MLTAQGPKTHRVREGTPTRLRFKDVRKLEVRSAILLLLLLLLVEIGRTVLRVAAACCLALLGMALLLFLLLLLLLRDGSIPCSLT